MSEMLEKILSDDNIKAAYKRVYANKGAGGVDGITINELAEYMKEHWKSIKQQIRERKYKPQPVLRVEILRPPSKNRHKKASKNEMNRSISLIYENRPHLFHGLLDNEPLPA